MKEIIKCDEVGVNNYFYCIVSLVYFLGKVLVFGN